MKWWHVLLINVSVEAIQAKHEDSRESDNFLGCMWTIFHYLTEDQIGVLFNTSNIEIIIFKYQIYLLSNS